MAVFANDDSIMGGGERELMVEAKMLSKIGFIERVREYLGLRKKKKKNTFAVFSMAT